MRYAPLAALVYAPAADSIQARNETEPSARRIPSGGRRWRPTSALPAGSLRRFRREGPRRRRSSAGRDGPRPCRRRGGRGPGRVGGARCDTRRARPAWRRRRGEATMLRRACGALGSGAGPAHATAKPADRDHGRRREPAGVARARGRSGGDERARRPATGVALAARCTPRAERYALCPTTVSQAATSTRSATRVTRRLKHEHRGSCDSAADLGHERHGHPEGRAARPSDFAPDR
jgi:hypothetical protein